MPVTKQLRVIVGDPKEGLKNGDTVTIKGTSGIVQGQRELNKNMEVTIQTGEDCSMTRRVPLGSEINVLRSEQTADEKLAEDIDKFTARVERHWSDEKHSMERQFTTLATQYADHLAKGVGRPFDLDRAASIARTQETWALWEAVRVDAVEGDASSLVRSILFVRERCRDSLIQRFRNSLSRSTSVISNLTEDMKGDAAAEFLKQTDWLHVEDLAFRLGINTHDEN